MLHVILLYYSLIHCESAPIVATSSDSVNEYYVNDGNAWSDDMITCTKPNCFITINSGASYNLNIDASNAVNLHFECYADCHGTQITDGPSNTSDIICSVGNSCASSLFNLTSSSHVSLSCENDNSVSAGSCEYVDLYLNSADFVSIRCHGFLSFGDCSYMNIFAGNTNELDLECDFNYACRYLTFHGDNVVNAYLRALQDYSLRDSNIYVAHATQVKIDCLETESCRDMIIQEAPTGDQYNLQIYCADVSFGCRELYVYPYDDDIANLNFISLECPNTNARNTCNYIRLYCEGSSSSYETFAWSSTNSRWECNDESDPCCPWASSDDIIAPTDAPTSITVPPTGLPTKTPTDIPTNTPTDPSMTPTDIPSLTPTNIPSLTPTDPSMTPTNTPSDPSMTPSETPTNIPSLTPTDPSMTPTKAPTDIPTHTPSHPSMTPSETPTNIPSLTPTSETESPIMSPSFDTQNPSTTPTVQPTQTPTNPTMTPTKAPTDIPTNTPTDPSMTPTKAPTDIPTNTPSDPSMTPSETPTNIPSLTPTDPNAVNDVTINCTETASCMRSDILCGNGGLCTINCFGYDACQSIDIHGQSGSRIEFNANSSSFVTINADNADSLKVNCYYKGCYAIEINAKYANNVTILLNKEPITVPYEHTPSVIDVSNANYAFIYGNGSYVLYIARIYAQNISQLEVVCSGGVRYDDQWRSTTSTSCVDTYMHLPTDLSKVTLTCTSYGCSGINLITNATDFNALTTKYNYCADCLTISDCIPFNWNLKCDSDTTQYDGTCSNNNCDCETFHTNLESHSYQDVNDAMECQYSAFSTELEIDTEKELNSTTNAVTIVVIIFIVLKFCMITFSASKEGCAVANFDTTKTIETKDLDRLGVITTRGIVCCDKIPCEVDEGTGIAKYIVWTKYVLTILSLLFAFINFFIVFDKYNQTKNYKPGEEDMCCGIVRGYELSGYDTRNQYNLPQECLIDALSSGLTKSIDGSNICTGGTIACDSFGESSKTYIGDCLNSANIEINDICRLDPMYNIFFAYLDTFLAATILSLVAMFVAFIIELLSSMGAKWENRIKMCCTCIFISPLMLCFGYIFLLVNKGCPRLCCCMNKIAEVEPKKLFDLAFWFVEIILWSVATWEASLTAETYETGYQPIYIDGLRYRAWEKPYRFDGGCEYLSIVVNMNPLLEQLQGVMTFSEVLSTMGLVMTIICFVISILELAGEKMSEKKKETELQVKSVIEAGAKDKDGENKEVTKGSKEVEKEAEKNETKETGKTNV